MDYTSTFSSEDSYKILQELTRLCYSSSPCQLTESLKNLVIAGRFEDLARFDFRPWYDLFSSDQLFYARQIQAFFSKNAGVPIPGVDTEQVAWESFQSSEEKCRLTNERFRTYLPEWDVSGVLYTAQRKIARILGVCPDLSSLDFSFGPGANTSVRSREANIRVKLSRRASCSESMVPILGEFIKEFPLWHQYFADNNPEVDVVPGTLSFVPKTSLTDRAIVVEPSFNGVFQRGIGKEIRRRLKRAGLDLNTQENNRYGAFLGSVDGYLSTVDLSAASDTISYGLVLDLIPAPWFELLDQSRSGSVTYKKSDPIRLEKFSSMGNGYTFELESLIFWTLSLSVCEQIGLGTDHVVAFGDDIIIPSAAIPLLERVFTYCGFEINSKKSYWGGSPFRESCGVDYFRGIDIRPFYLKERLTVRHLFMMHNYFVRGCEPALAKCVLRHIPDHIRLYGPDGYGDGHLIGDWSPVRPRRIVRDGWEGGFFDTYRLRPLKYVRGEPGDWLYPSYSVYVRYGVNQASVMQSSDILDPPDFSGSSEQSLRGVRGYMKQSIYTRSRSIFSPASG